jgi:hypothetical protein
LTNVYPNNNNNNNNNKNNKVKSKPLELFELAGKKIVIRNVSSWEISGSRRFSSLTQASTNLKWILAV